MWPFRKNRKIQQEIDEKLRKWEFESHELHVSAQMSMLDAKCTLINERIDSLLNQLNKERMETGEEILYAYCGEKDVIVEKELQLQTDGLSYEIVMLQEEMGRIKEELRQFINENKIMDK